jgi:DNA replication protein DnaC
MHRQHVATETTPKTCDRHGPFTATLWGIQPKPAGYPNAPAGADLLTFLDPFWSKCPSCDSEIQHEVDEQHASIRSGKSKADAMLASRFREANIPKRLEQCGLDNYSSLLAGEKTALAAAKDYAYAFETQGIETGRCMVFLGKVGVGKSHLAVAILRHIMLRGGSGRYATVFEILSAIKATFAKGSTQTIEQVIETYARPDLLVIDEIGKQVGSDFEIANLFAVIDRRYADEKPMLLISNLSEAEFRALLGEAIVDRLRSNGGRLVKFFWESRRGEEA